MPSPQVCVILVNYNGGAHLQRCVDSLARQEERDFEVIIIDNASSDGSPQDLVLPDARFRLIVQDSNIGFAAANNRGARETDAAWIATLNPDAFPAPDWLSALLRAARAHPDVAMFGSVQLSDRDPSLWDGVGDVYSLAGLPWRGGYHHPVKALPVLAEIFSPCAAAALYRRDAFFGSGGFDERFFCYCEDVDLGFRLRLRGDRCLLVSAARVNHVGGATTGTESTFTVYHGARNRIWTMVKNMPLGLLILAVPLHGVSVIALGLRALRLDAPARRAYLTALMGGVRDGLIGLGPTLRARRSVQAARTAPWWTIARSFCWSPGKAMRYAPDLRTP